MGMGPDMLVWDRDFDEPSLPEMRCRWLSRFTFLSCCKRINNLIGNQALVWAARHELRHVLRALGGLTTLNGLGSSKLGQDRPAGLRRKNRFSRS